MAEIIPQSLRASQPKWFDGVLHDCDGTAFRTYDRVTPIKVLSQVYDDQEAPIVLQPGEPQLVLSIADDNPAFIWIEPQAGPFSGADVVVPTALVRVMDARDGSVG